MLQSLSLFAADIAGIRVALDAPPRMFEGPLGERFRRWPATGAPSLRIAVSGSHRVAPSPSGRGGQIAEYELDIARTGSRLAISGWWLDGWVDLGTGDGEARVAERDAAGSVENFLRVAVAHLLLPEGGFLLHACAVVLENGDAVVGFGPSGAGKTTLSSHAAGRKVISDDLVALRRNPDGALVVVPTPFRAGNAPACAQGHRVAALARLRQASVTPFGLDGAPPRAPGVSVRRLDVRRGALELLGAMPFVHDATETAELALGLAETAARAPGVVELSVPPSPGVWDEIEKALA